MSRKQCHTANLEGSLSEGACQHLRLITYVTGGRGQRPRGTTWMASRPVVCSLRVNCSLCSAAFLFRTFSGGTLLPHRCIHMPFCILFVLRILGTNARGRRLTGSRPYKLEPGTLRTERPFMQNRESVPPHTSRHTRLATLGRGSAVPFVHRNPHLPQREGWGEQGRRVTMWVGTARLELLLKHARTLLTARTDSSENS